MALKRSYRTVLHFKKHVVKVVQEYAEELIISEEEEEPEQGEGE